MLNILKYDNSTDPTHCCTTPGANQALYFVDTSRVCVCIFVDPFWKSSEILNVYTIFHFMAENE